MVNNKYCNFFPPVLIIHAKTEYNEKKPEYIHK